MHRSSFAVVVSLVAVGGLFAGCGGGDDADEPAAPAGSEAHTGSGDHGGSSDTTTGARKIAVEGNSFSFDPEEITVTAGEAVAIALTSKDIQHDFTIDDLDAHVVAKAGDTAIRGFRADKPGRYTFYCAVSGHRQAGMEGTLVVEAS